MERTLRVVLVGRSADDRARLRAVLEDGDIEIVAEHDSINTWVADEVSPVDGVVLAERSLGPSDTTVDVVHEPLTPREREVLDLVSLGLSNKEIGHRLRISEHTVKFHVSSICGKLGAATRAEAVRIGVQRGEVAI